jgi:hypothetical protein
MANTNILIKRAGVGGAGRPSSLLAGELAYSYASNTIFIGSPTGNGVVNVGGQFYTSQIDNATDAATGSTLVRRDATGNASFNFITANIVGEIIGNANSATQLQTARNFSIDGGDITAGAISFNGTGDVVLNASLDAVPSLDAGTYGSTTSIPVIQVAANGRVMNVTTAAITTSFTVAGDSGTPQTVSGGDTLTLVGGAGITSVASATDTVTFDVDDTVVRANAFTGGTQTINTNLTIGANNDLTVTGNLIVFGNTSTLNIVQFEIQDPLLLLGVGNYFSDTFDIGFASHYNDGSNAHTGLIRDAGTKEYHFFQGYTGELDANNNINLSDPSYREANVTAAYFKGNTIGDTVQANTIYVANRIFGDTTNNTLVLAPSVNYGPGVNDQYIILDPTANGHIHVRAGGTIDASSAELYLGGEQTNVQVSDGAKEVYIRANNAHVWTFGNDGTLEAAGKILAAQGANTAGGYSFSGTEGDNDSGMFSNADGNVHFYADSTDVAYFTPAEFVISRPAYLTTITANTLALNNALTVPNGGTGVTSFTSGQIVIGSGTNGLTQIANSSVAIGQTFGSASSVAAFETDVYGRVVAVSNTAIVIDASAITSGTLPIARGGTNGTSFTDNQITYFDGTKIASLANTTYTQTGTLTSNNTITSITVDGFGRFTAATVGAISGLTVEQGGTGLSTITQNGITYGNGTGVVGVTAAAGVADQTWSNQILTVTNAGVPVWTTALDGGVF